MRFLLVLLCVGQIIHASASEIQLEGGLVVTGSLAIYSKDGATLIHHGATPDEFFTWDKIAALGLGSHEATLREQYLKTHGRSTPVSEEDSQTDGSSVNLATVFDFPQTATATATATGARKTPAGSPLKIGALAEVPKVKPTIPTPKSLATFDHYFEKLHPYLEHPSLGGGKYLGLMVAAIYFVLVLAAFASNLTAKKKKLWKENPDTVRKAINTAFGLWIVSLIVLFVLFHFFPKLAEVETIPLSVIAIAMVVLLLPVLGLRAKSRICALILLALAVGVNLADFATSDLADLTTMNIAGFLISCVYTFATVDAVFACFHFQSGKHIVSDAGSAAVPQPA